MRTAFRRLGGGAIAVLGLFVTPLATAAADDELGRRDRYLTRPAAGDPARLALDYVRAHGAALGLDGDDTGRLALTDRYTSLDGVTHLIWTQQTRGVDAYGAFVGANVAADGRLINITGSPAPDLQLDSAEPRRRPPAGRGAKLVAFPAAGGARLAWQVTVGAEELVVDAGDGATLSRRSLRSDANSALIYDHHPDRRIAPRTVNLGADPTWIDRSEGGTKLQGNNAHVTQFVEFTGDPTEVAQVNGDWAFPAQFFTHAECPPFGCTWNSDDAFATRLINREQTAVQSFYLVNHFHDHLLAPPIGFDEASRNFEFVNSTGQGQGGDAVEVFANHAIRNNATFTFANEGSAPSIALGRFNVAWDVRGGDIAELVYHEYTHGLTSRLIGSGNNSSAGAIGNALDEGWSDWYAEDLVVEEGLVGDTAAPGEVYVGEGYAPPPWRTEGIDCPVGSSGPACPGTATAGAGGYTFADFGHVLNGLEPHADGEIWAQTLWDLRTRIGAAAARCIVTGGLRLGPASPGFLSSRDAILQSALVVGVSQQAVWEVFAARGMGANATELANPRTDDFTVPDLPSQPAPTGSCGVPTTPPGGGNGGGGGSGGGGGGGGGVVVPSGPTADQIAAQLRSDVKPVATALRKLHIGKLRKRGSFTAKGLDALAAGRFTVQLKRGSLTIAKGSRAVGAAGRYALKAKLTAKGRRALRRAGRVKCTLVIAFQPLSGPASRRTAKVTLRR